MKFYCVKCKQHKEVDDKEVKEKQSKNGRLMEQAKCPTCGINMTRFKKKVKSA